MFKNLLAKQKLSIDDGGFIDKQLNLNHFESWSDYFRKKNIVGSGGLNIGNLLKITENDLDETIMNSLAELKHALLNVAKEKKIYSGNGIDCKLLSGNFSITDHLDSISNEIWLRFGVNSHNGENPVLVINYHEKTKKSHLSMAFSTRHVDYIRCHNVKVNVIDEIKDIFTLLCKKITFERMVPTELSRETIRENLSDITSKLEAYSR